MISLVNISRYIFSSVSLGRLSKSIFLEALKILIPLLSTALSISASAKYSLSLPVDV